jgi:hypothetical protein
VAGPTGSTFTRSNATPALPVPYGARDQPRRLDYEGVALVRVKSVQLYFVEPDAHERNVCFGDAADVERRSVFTNGSTFYTL